MVSDGKRSPLGGNPGVKLNDNLFGFYHAVPVRQRAGILLGEEHTVTALLVPTAELVEIKDNTTIGIAAKIDTFRCFRVSIRHVPGVAQMEHLRRVLARNIRLEGSIPGNRSAFHSGSREVKVTRTPFVSPVYPNYIVRVAAKLGTHRVVADEVLLGGRERDRDIIVNLDEPGLLLLGDEVRDGRDDKALHTLEPEHGFRGTLWSVSLADKESTRTDSVHAILERSRGKTVGDRLKEPETAEHRSLFEGFCNGVKLGTVTRNKNAVEYARLIGLFQLLGKVADAVDCHMDGVLFSIAVVHPAERHEKLLEAEINGSKDFILGLPKCLENLEQFFIVVGFSNILAGLLGVHQHSASGRHIHEVANEFHRVRRGSCSILINQAARFPVADFRNVAPAVRLDITIHEKHRIGTKGNPGSKHLDAALLEFICSD